MPNILLCCVSVVNRCWQMWSLCDVLEQRYCTYVRTCLCHCTHFCSILLPTLCAPEHNLWGTICSLNSSLFSQIILILVCSRSKLTRCQSFQVCVWVYCVVLYCTVWNHMWDSSSLQSAVHVCCVFLWTNWVEIVDQGLVVDDLTISLMAVCRCEDLFVFWTSYY